MRCAARYLRWSDMSIGPDGQNNPVLKSAYWRGVMAALDAVYLCESEHARAVVAASNRKDKDDIEDAQMVMRVVRRAVRACRRDIAVTSREGKWTNNREEVIEAELSYYLRLAQHPEDCPAFKTNSMYMDGLREQIHSDEIGPYNRTSDYRRDDEVGQAADQPEVEDGETEADD